jgi:hypothetical protein
MRQMKMSHIPARLRRNLYFILPVGLYLLLRIPSLMEPQWYQDEAGYASTVWLTHLGYGLYVDAWNNKPPLLFGIFGLSRLLWGTSEAGLHLIVAFSGLAAMAAAVWGMARLYSPRAALWSGLLLALIIGTPMLDGDLALPESLLIGPATVGVALFLCSSADPSVRPRAAVLVLIGLLLASAALIQQTALADIAAILLWCLVRRSWRTMVILGGTVLVTGVAVLVPFLISAGVHNVWFALVSSYVGYLNGSLHAQTVAFVFRVIAIAAMVAAAWYLRNASDSRFELVRIWATALLFAAIAAGYSYEHFLLPLMVPLVMLITGMLSRHRDRILQSVRLPRAVFAAATFALIASSGWSLFAAGYRSMVWSAGYYANAVSYMSGSISDIAYDRYFGVDTYGEQRAAAWIRSHGRSGSTAMLWTNLAWPLVDDDLVPPTRSGPLYVTLALENGTALILSRMEASPPDLILITPASIENLQDIRGFISNHIYRQVLAEGGVELYVRSDG